MAEKWTKEELLDKVEWEGGVVAEVICEYGISPDCLPDGTPAGIREAWARLYTQGRKDIEAISEWLYG